MTSPPRPAPDPAQVDAFATRAFADLAATFVTLHVALGDRHGLFKAIAARGAATPQQLASWTGTHERYVREWASCLASAGYLRHDPAAGTFDLAPEAVPVLAEEGGAAFLCGFHQVTAALVKQLGGVERAFREGGGVPSEAFGPELWIGEERSNEAWHKHLLVQDWLPRMPAVVALLERGGDVLDLGCGGGRALVRIAKAFPKARCLGLDIDPGSVERARSFAKEEGVADRVRFEVRDLAQGIPGSHDVITALDVVHDVQDPMALLRAARAALRPGGRLVVMDMNSPDRLEDGSGPIPALLFGMSTFYCMTISLARGGEGWGTAGLPHARLQRAAREAGFREVRRVETGNPVQALYEVAGP